MRTTFTTAHRPAFPARIPAMGGGTKALAFTWKTRRGSPLKARDAGRTMLLPGTLRKRSPIHGETQTGWGPVRLHGEMRSVGPPSAPADTGVKHAIRCMTRTAERQRAVEPFSVRRGRRRGRIASAVSMNATDPACAMHGPVVGRGSWRLPHTPVRASPARRPHSPATARPPALHLSSLQDPGTFDDAPVGQHFSAIDPPAHCRYKPRRDCCTPVDGAAPGTGDHRGSGPPREIGGMATRRLQSSVGARMEEPRNAPRPQGGPAQGR